MIADFKNIPVEEGTVVLSRNVEKISGFWVCNEIWCWEGITAESIIFRQSDVCHLGDQEIKDLVISNRKVVDSSSMTFVRGSNFVFCNFNFIESDD